MINETFKLLSLHPMLSIILGFLLSIFIFWVFRDEIKDYVRKKYNLYSKEEILIKLTEVVYSPDIVKFGTEVSRNLEPKYQAVGEKILNKFSDKL